MARVSSPDLSSFVPPFSFLFHSIFFKFYCSVLRLGVRCYPGGNVGRDRAAALVGAEDVWTR